MSLLSRVLTQAERRFFKQVFGNTPDAKELLEVVPSARLTGSGRFLVDERDADALSKYLDETVTLEKGNRLPPSCYSGDFVRKLAPDASAEGKLVATTGAGGALAVGAGVGAANAGEPKVVR